MTDSDGEAPAPTNNKTSNERLPRCRSLKGGIISYQNFAITIDCVVRDQSENGVKLKVEENQMIPDRFFLTIPVDGVKAECEVRWRNGREIGAVYVSNPALDSRNARKQVVESQFIAPRRATIRKKVEDK